MGFLGFGDYNKPGKGVSKDIPEKKGFFLFWDIAFHKFTKIVGANALYTVTSVIWLAFLAVLCMPFIVGATSEDVIGIFARAGQEMNMENADAMLRVLYINGAFLIFNLLGSGPVSASYAYAVKCFTHRQHVWLFAEGWSKFKENLKQSVIVLLINTLVVICGGTALKFYATLAGEQAIFGILLYVLTVFLILFVWMNFYIYQIMTSVKCTIKQLYKNAAIFAITKLPMNLFLTLLTVGVSALSFMYVSNFLTIFIVMGVIGMFFTRFAIEFSASRTVNKLLVKNSVTIKYDEEKVFDDNLAETIKRDEE